MTLRAPILVFDLDGTLADTARDLIATLNALLAREGLPLVAPSAARSLVGAGARALVERGFAIDGAPLAPERVDPLVRDFLDHYEAHIADETMLFPGALAALDRFASAGFRLAVCTNKPEPLARLLLEKLDAADRFAAICGRGTFPMHKPDPRTLALTIEAAGGDPRRAVMVGDSKTDVDTAKNAGTPVVAVDFGYTDIPVAELAPDRVISHFDELWAAAEAILHPSAFGRT
ncbi:HAD family hydrolase [Methylocystis parvus]|uniref:Phosphoglycolate phosphatase n=1 Tax=Methylocystis parvus TaxID=134 RepID=A0A6B8M5Y3_9HYPH|nr:HAD family hydrolase [Methylocystis parvus]QGM97826.1 phosphoglycolate phosphatase [Methylocystis parvus]WBK01865.1 phosphoglycolate phosphatase [Methylocystis parvus OBBP]